MCFLNFGLCILYTFLYPALLCFLSFARLQVVAEPFSTDFKKMGFVLKCLFGISGAAVFISISLTLLAWIMTKDEGLPFFLCSPFIDPTNSLIMIDILTWFMSFGTTTASVLIFIIYMKLTTELRASQQKVARAKSERKIQQIFDFSGCDNYSFKFTLLDSQFCDISDS